MGWMIWTLKLGDNERDMLPVSQSKSATDEVLCIIAEFQAQRSV